MYERTYAQTSTCLLWLVGCCSFTSRATAEALGAFQQPVGCILCFAFSQSTLLIKQTSNQEFNDDKTLRKDGRQASTYYLAIHHPYTRYGLNRWRR